MNKGTQIGHQMALIAAEHAGAEWSEVAYEAFVDFAKSRKYFTTEEVRQSSDVPAPPDSRVWGAIPLKAKKDGVVSAAGWVKAQSTKVHGMVVTQWESNVYQDVK
jgi:hypothetical protein